MPGFIPEMAEMAGANGKSILLPMEQSRIADGFAGLLLSIRPGERALPLTGEVRETCAKSAHTAIGQFAIRTIYKRRSKGEPLGDQEWKKKPENREPVQPTMSSLAQRFQRRQTEQNKARYGNQSCRIAAHE